MIFLDFVFRNDQTSNFGEKKTTIHPIKLSVKRVDGHSKRERMEIIDLHLNAFFQDNREVKRDVYGRRQTASITSDFLFSSCNP